jgi:hypothetical protein
MLAFDEETPPAYVLYVESPDADDRLLQLGEILDDLLGENYHYRYCRDLGQLSTVRVFRVAANGRESYLRRCVELGQRLGDVKPRALHRMAGWSEVFSGRMVT